MSQTTIRARKAGRTGTNIVVGGFKKLLYMVVGVTVLVCLIMFGLFLIALNHVN